MEIAGYITMLNRNTGELLNLVKGRDEDAVNHKSFNSWSILQVLEHLLITERYVLELLSRPGEKMAESGEIKGVARLDRILVEHRDRKVKAPDMLEPKGGINDLEEFGREFLQLRNQLAVGLEKGAIVVDSRVHSHPMLGEMTVSDWLYFLISHARRHMEQIKDILRSLKQL